MHSKSTKKSLVASGLSLLVCAALLIGTTFAWFTDSVSNKGNKIEAGTLNVSLSEWDDEAGAYVEVGEDPIFNSTLWEPGYTDITAVKISNEGTLALKYELDIIADGATDLAEVIDVYYYDDGIVSKEAGLPENFTALKDSGNYVNLGTLAELMANTENGLARGNLSAGADDFAIIALHMQETAGNEYQGASIGTTFDIVLKATQDTVEADGFNNTEYDAGAEWPITTSEEAYAVLTDSTTENVVINGNISIQGDERWNISSDKTIDFGGNTLKRKAGSGNGLLIGEKDYDPYPVTVTIENGNFVSEDGSEAVRIESGSTATFRDCTFSAGIESFQSVGEKGAKTTLVFENCTFVGTVNLEGLSGGGTEYDVVFRNCSFTGTSGNGGAAVRINSYVYGTVDFDNCDISAVCNGNAVTGIDIGAYYGSNDNNPITVTLKDTEITLTTGEKKPGDPVKINSKQITTLNIEGSSKFMVDSTEKVFDAESQRWQDK